MTPDELAAIAPLAEADRCISTPPNRQEVEECIAWSGRRPVEWLLEHAPVDRRWCLIHATHMTATETAALAGSGAVAGLCPITEASLGDGIFPTREFLDAGGRFGVGTDSNVLVGVTDELRQLEYGQRLKHRERNVLSGGPGVSTGRALFDAALAGGARRSRSQSSASRLAHAPTSSPSTPRIPRSPGVAGIPSSTAGFLQRARLPSPVWAGGNKVVERGHHRLRQPARAAFNAAVRRLVA